MITPFSRYLGQPLKFINVLVQSDDLHIGLVSWFLSILSLRGRLNLGNKILSHIYLNLFTRTTFQTEMTKSRFGASQGVAEDKMQPVSLGQNLSRGHSSFENEEVSSTRTGKAAIPLVSHAFTSSSLFSTSSSETGYTAAKSPSVSTCTRLSTRA